MSWLPAPEPEIAPPGCPGLELTIVARTRDLGGFEVRRALPSARRRMVGPWVFLDQMGPSLFVDGTGLDVRPHPHIGLATVTYLLEGEIEHKDSLGTWQTIRPGELNWMTAGRGIAHSERTGAALRRAGHRLFGLQSWIALPRAHEETEPGFQHYAAGAMPVIEDRDKRVRIIAGALYGARSPVTMLSEAFYVDAALEPGGKLPLPAEHEERAVYIAAGAVEVAGDRFGDGTLLIVRPGDEITLGAVERSRMMLLGGEPMDGPRHIWWNFVSSSRERIEQAKADWQAGRFARVPGDDELIPLPES
jgi:redox-sensitive bicupin YhaK (pirin superfamily)